MIIISNKQEVVGTGEVHLHLQEQSTSIRILNCSVRWDSRRHVRNVGLHTQVQVRSFICWKWRVTDWLQLNLLLVLVISCSRWWLLIIVQKLCVFICLVDAHFDCSLIWHRSNYCVWRNCCIFAQKWRNGKTNARKKPEIKKMCSEHWVAYFVIASFNEAILRQMLKVE